MMRKLKRVIRRVAILVSCIWAWLVFKVTKRAPDPKLPMEILSLDTFVFRGQAKYCIFFSISERAREMFDVQPGTTSESWEGEWPKGLRPIETCLGIATVLPNDPIGIKLSMVGLAMRGFNIAEWHLGGAYTEKFFPSDRRPRASEVKEFASWAMSLTPLGKPPTLSEKEEPISR